jgi:deoxycytidylate deaminase
MHYFEKAREVAKLSDFSKTHIGCVAVYQNRIVGIGCNSNKTHPNQKVYNKYRNLFAQPHSEPIAKIHAEIMCLNSISKLDIDFSKVHLYVYRIRKDIPFGLSKPCNACMNAIKDLGIKHIHYTTNDGYATEDLVDI